MRSIWRPLAKVRSWPLALCDARTVDPSDLVTCDIVRRRYVGETYFGKYNQAQQWFYLSDMDVNELVLVKVYDSDPDVSAKRKRDAENPIELLNLRSPQVVYTPHFKSMPTQKPDRL